MYILNNCNSLAHSLIYGIIVISKCAHIQQQEVFLGKNINTLQLIMRFILSIVW